MLQASEYISCKYIGIWRRTCERVPLFEVIFKAIMSLIGGQGELGNLH